LEVMSYYAYRGCDNKMSYSLGVRKVFANCETCGKHWEGANSQGVAAIHARKYNHKVYVDIYQVVIYEGEE